MNQRKGILISILLGVIFVFVFFGPMFTIWSLNALFGLEIPVSFKTWCAVLWLMTVIHGIKITLKRNQ